GGAGSCRVQESDRANGNEHSGYSKACRAGPERQRSRLEGYGRRQPEGVRGASAGLGRRRLTLSVTAAKRLIRHFSCARRQLTSPQRCHRVEAHSAELINITSETTVSTIADSLPIERSAAADRRRRIVAIVGASSGNLVEWSVFRASGFPSISFAAAFFPRGDPPSQFLAPAGIFAVGFFMRPLGGWLFGWIADKRGRRISMIISVLMMCAGSLTIAVMP